MKREAIKRRENDENNQDSNWMKDNKLKRKWKVFQDVQILSNSSVVWWILLILQPFSAFYRTGRHRTQRKSHKRRRRSLRCKGIFPTITRPCRRGKRKTKANASSTFKFSFERFSPYNNHLLWLLVFWVILSMYFKLRSLVQTSISVLLSRTPAWSLPGKRRRTGGYHSLAWITCTSH